MDEDGIFTTSTWRTWPSGCKGMVRDYKTQRWQLHTHLIYLVPYNTYFIITLTYPFKLLYITRCGTRRRQSELAFIYKWMYHQQLDLMVTVRKVVVLQTICGYAAVNRRTSTGAKTCYVIPFFFFVPTWPSSLSTLLLAPPPLPNSFLRWAKSLGPSLRMWEMSVCLWRIYRVVNMFLPSPPTPHPSKRFLIWYCTNPHNPRNRIRVAQVTKHKIWSELIRLEYQ